ncbi:MAG: hypothetical protein LBQ19_00895, partial [Synergistaceae bacterium]|nr:hypothetical protein [Synergistaceae bacterium]
MSQWLKTKLKQLWFPAQFRLPEPEFTKEQLDLLEELIQLIQPTLSKAESDAADERVSMARFLVDLGTGVWRIRRKIESLSRMPKEIKDALYSLESTWASMAGGGVEIIDHIGAIPSKNEAKVVEVRDIPNLSRDQVIDTLKPTILLRGEVIQVGEVVVGRHVSAEAPAEDTPGEEAEDEPVTTVEVETLSIEEPITATPETDEAPEELPGDENTEAGGEGVLLEETPPDDAGESSAEAESPPEAPMLDETTGEDAGAILDDKPAEHLAEADEEPVEVPDVQDDAAEELPAQTVEELPVETQESDLTTETLVERVETHTDPSPDAQTTETHEDEAPEEKPKKRRTARKPKAEKISDGDEAPKTKRTRKKKQAQEA